MREQSNPAAEKRAEPIRFTQRQQMQDVDPRDEVGDVVEIANGETLDQRAFQVERPQPVRALDLSVRQCEGTVIADVGDRGFSAPSGNADWTAGAEIDWNERVSIGRKA